MAEISDAGFLLDLLQNNISSDRKQVRENDFYQWPDKKRSAAGHQQLPYVIYSENMERLWRYFEDMGYLRPCPDYAGWMEKNTAMVGSGTDWIEKADSPAINNYLFGLKRAERFGDGKWASRVSNGEFLAIYRRIQALGPCKPD